jgi:hypothetical protein
LGFIYLISQILANTVVIIPTDSISFDLFPQRSPFQTVNIKWGQIAIQDHINQPKASQQISRDLIAVHPFPNT